MFILSPIPLDLPTPATITTSSPLPEFNIHAVPSSADINAAFNHISNSPLPHHIRNLLRAAAYHAPNTFFVHGILHASPEALICLANITHQALIAFRNRGGRPSNASNKSPIHTSTSPESTSWSATLPEDLSPNFLALITAYGIALEDILEFDTIFKEATRTSTQRRPSGFSTSVAQRSSSPDSCLLTGKSLILTSAHILPTSLFTLTLPALTQQQTVLFLFLTFFLSPPLLSHLSTALQAGQGATCANGLRLLSLIHEYFDQGLLTLIPVSITTTSDSAHETEMVVKLAWHHEPTTLDLMTTRHGDGVGKRELRNGDLFMINTRDPKRYPLPIPGFLQLHHLLWNVIGMGGLAMDGSRGWGDSVMDNGGAETGSGNTVKRRRKKPAFVQGNSWDHPAAPPPPPGPSPDPKSGHSSPPPPSHPQPDLQNPTNPSSSSGGPPETSPHTTTSAYRTTTTQSESQPQSRSVSGSSTSISNCTRTSSVSSDSSCPHKKINQLTGDITDMSEDWKGDNSPPASPFLDTSMRIVKREYSELSGNFFHGHYDEHCKLAITSQKDQSQLQDDDGVEENRDWNYGNLDMQVLQKDLKIIQTQWNKQLLSSSPASTTTTTNTNSEAEDEEVMFDSDSDENDSMSDFDQGLQFSDNSFFTSPSPFSTFQNDALESDLSIISKSWSSAITGKSGGGVGLGSS